MKDPLKAKRTIRSLKLGSLRVPVMVPHETKGSLAYAKEVLFSLLVVTPAMWVCNLYFWSTGSSKRLSQVRYLSLEQRRFFFNYCYTNSSYRSCFCHRHPEAE